MNDYADVKNHAGKKPLLTVLSSQLFIILKNRQLEAINVLTLPLIEVFAEKDNKVGVSYEACSPVKI